MKFIYQQYGSSTSSSSFGCNSTVKTYASGGHYDKNELIIDTTYEKLYLVTKSFTASGNINNDVANGYIVLIASSVYIYTSGVTYYKDTLIYDKTNNKLYVATQNFTAKDIKSDVSNGYIKEVSSNIVKHTHTKSDITDFNENDYVHTSGNEIINGDKIFNDNVTIQGDLTVKGTTTTVDTDNLSIKDNEIVLNAGETGSGVSIGTSGISIDRGSEPSAKLLFDESVDKWKVGIDPNYYFLATEDWVNTNFASKTHNHTLSDITDFPTLAGNANKVLTVNSTEDGVIWTNIITTDELVKIDSSDPTAGYLSDKIDNNTIIIDTTNNVIKVNGANFAPSVHTHSWSDIDKTNSRLSDISDVPDYTGNAGKVLIINSTEDGIEYKNITDELVKINSSDPSSGYLADKIDTNTLDIDTTNYKIKVKDGVFASVVHNHTWADIDKTGSKLSDIEDVPDYTGNAGKFLAVNSAEDGVTWADIITTDEKVKTDPSDSNAGYLADKVDNATIEVDTANHKIKVKDNIFAPKTHIHNWSDVDKTGSKLEDIENVSKPTSSNTYLSYNGTNYVWKEIFAKAYKYQSGQTYVTGDLITNSTYTDLFIATKTFTASDIVTDTKNGNLKSLTSSSSLTYKQYDYTGSAGDSVTITLTKSNTSYDRHVFVLQKQKVSAINIEPFKFDGSDTNLDYDSNWVIMDGNVHLKKTEKKTTVHENIYYKATINVGNYKDVVSIDVEFK